MTSNLAALRRACAGWPQPVERQAEAAVLDEPEAALVAAWLVADNDAPAPPLTVAQVEAIQERLWAARH